MPIPFMKTDGAWFTDDLPVNAKACWPTRWAPDRRSCGSSVSGAGWWRSASFAYGTIPRRDYFPVGTGIPAILSGILPRLSRVVMYRFFQSSPPQAMLVVAGSPWAMIPK